ncbi:MAG: type II toxin-antitoxin system VapC family toxin [Bacillota bacterium]|nr:type II toxin-antitoxin system VapC family toxin [Bacillota bacterium]
MWLIDTNIFIYAVGKPHPHQEESKKIIEKAVAYPENYNINTEILQEILHVYLNKNQIEKGIDLVDSMLDIFPNPFQISTEEIHRGCILLKKYKTLNVRDALHAAVVKYNNLEGIITYDRHFNALRELKVLRPS